ncbi:hypothetical protein Hanom_Chr15g01392811 [Helianthus anomalus]
MVSASEPTCAAAAVVPPTYGKRPLSSDEPQRRHPLLTSDLRLPPPDGGGVWRRLRSRERERTSGQSHGPAVGATGRRSEPRTNGHCLYPAKCTGVGSDWFKFRFFRFGISGSDFGSTRFDSV